MVFWLSETRQICSFQAFSWECIGGIGSIYLVISDEMEQAIFSQRKQLPSRGYPNPSGRAPALTLAGYAPCDRAPPEMHPLKMFEILGHPHFKHLHGHKIPMNATNLPDRLNLYIFSLNLSYHSFVSVHDIQQNDFWIKLVFTLLLIPADITVLPMWRFSSRARVMVVPPVTSSEVTWFTWSPLWRSTHLPNSEIFIARNNAFFIATAHVVKDAVAKILG